MKNTTSLISTFLLVGAQILAACGPISPGPLPEKTPTGMPPTQIPTVAATEIPKLLSYGENGWTENGEWSASATINPPVWSPGVPVTLKTSVKIPSSLVEHLAQDHKFRVDGLVVLATAERTFDSDGWIRLSSDERMSTLVTPTGMGIEGGVQGAVTNRFGYEFKTPLDELATLPIQLMKKSGDLLEGEVSITTRIPDNIPPGIYRVRLDYGFSSNKRYVNFCGEGFARRPFFKGRPYESHLYSPPIRTSSMHVSGKMVDAAKIQPRLPWVILSGYNSNGYRGVVANEDKKRFVLSNRNIIHDEVILPFYDDAKKVIAYNLEPQFPTDTIEDRSNIPWDYTRGELSIKVMGPDGRTSDLGKYPIVAKAGQGATTKKAAFTAWKPAGYGLHSVQVSGWIADKWGNRYDGGGTYQFWIAKRMTLATATFQGMAYPVGNRYGRDIGFSPAVPADVEVSATLFVNSDPNNPRTISYSGKATSSGLFGASQGMKPLPFDAPGEYLGVVLAKYIDRDGDLWVSTMRHAGVVYPDDSPIAAHGKKVTLKNGKLEDRGDTLFEGWADKKIDFSQLAHVNFPYRSGDVLLIAAEGTGANKIEPVLTFEDKKNPTPYDPAWQGIGVTNVKLKTSNGLSPHMFPEYITDWMYYYAAGPRPGFMGRFLVGENGVRAPYWPTSSTNFGGQINTTNNGDQPGDIYRLIGGVVIRRKGETPAYAGYLANGFILPNSSYNNRVIAAGEEDLVGPTGEKARIFLVGTRPGAVYDTGTGFAPALQIDPILPVNVVFTLFYPDGRKVAAQGQGDVYGSFVGKDRWIMDIPGIYRFTIEAEWQGHKAIMPGLSAEGGEIYVVEKEKPAGAASLVFQLPSQSSFPATTGVTISGSTTGKVVHYAAVIPGAAVLQGKVPVTNGKFEYSFKPQELASRFPTYDIQNFNSGKTEIGDVVHLTFFSQETTPGGATYHDFVRLIIRGNVIHYVR